MEETIEYMEIKTFNAERAVYFGYELTSVDRMIMLRSGDTHTEIKHTKRFGGISFSATMADSCKCCRFKKIKYTHPEFWDIVYVPCTYEQELIVMNENLKMAGLTMKSLQNFIRTGAEGEVAYGVTAERYDLIGLLSFTTDLDIIKHDPNKKWCTRAVFCGLLKAWPDLLYTTAKKKEIKTYDLTPILGDMIARNYFRNKQAA